MNIKEKAKRFADRHVGRNCVDNSFSRDEWYWYNRLYFRFLSFHLDQCLRIRINENAFGLPGIIEERAEDWLGENPRFHCERGAICHSGERMKELYAETIKENL